MLIYRKDFEVEQDEMSRADPPVFLTRELWVSFDMIHSHDPSLTSTVRQIDARCH